MSPMCSPQLSSAQDQVLAALSTGASLSEAAAAAAVHRNTVGNWRRSSFVFQNALAHAQYDRILQVREQAEALAGDALKTIRQILGDANAAPSVRLKAALAILQQASTLPPEPPLSLLSAARPAAPPEIVHNSAQPALAPYRREEPKTGRNEPCPCGSGRKFKQCCLNKPAAFAAVPLTPLPIPIPDTHAPAVLRNSHGTD